MIESASYRICVIDGKPVEESKVYQTIVQEFGEETAEKWTDEVIVNLTHPPPEVLHGHHRTCTLGHRTLERPYVRRHHGIPHAEMGHVRNEKIAHVKRK